METENTLDQLRSELSPEKLALLEKLKGLKVNNQISGIPRRKETGPVPLSFAQQRLWFLDQLVPNNPAYNVIMAFHLSGPLRVDILERSINEIIRRHESMRTSFRLIDGKAFQVIDPKLIINIPIINLETTPESKREQEFYKQAKNEAKHVFNLTQGPLFHFTLFKMGSQKHVLLINIHHIVIDAWSMGVFFKELYTLYSFFSQGKASPLPDLAIQYADFSAWQREYLKGDVLEKQLSYWKERIGNEKERHELPADRSRPAIQNFEGGNLKFQLPQTLTKSLKSLSQQENSTLFMILTSALNVLIYRYTQHTNVIIGSPIANRNKVELENLIGFFVNTMVLKTDLSGNPTFKEVIGRMREVAQGAYKNQDVPFELIVDKIQPERDMSHNPLFQVCFVLQNAPRPINSSDIVIEKVEEIRNDTSKFDLWISMLESEDVIYGEVEYNSAVFNESTISGILESFQIILQEVVKDPNKKIAAISILSEQEKNKLLKAWNDTRVDYDGADSCLHQLIEQQVNKTPGNPAVIVEGKKLSYEALNKKSNQLANYLIKQKVSPGDKVGVCIERSHELVIALLGILKAGCCYVPLDPDYPIDRLTFMACDSQMTVLLTKQHLATKIPGITTPVICVDTDWITVMNESDSTPRLSLTNKAIAYMIYTSGSTGKPKGVKNTHRGIVNRLLWMQHQYQLNNDDRVIQKTPFSFDVSVWEFFWPLLTGASIVMAKPEGHKDPLYLAELIQKENVTTIHFVPSMLAAFLEEEEVTNCKSLKRVICSGEALPYSLQERFFKRISAELHNLYGPTEAAVDVTYWKCQQNDESKIVPIGKPVANTQIYLLDEFLNPVPIGVPGELHIGGVQVALGYHQRPELTSEKFIADSFSKNIGATLYKTGDLACYLPDGNIKYLGRIDFQVKIRGIRIEQGEIEAVINSHPAVHTSIVMAREFENNPENKHLVAYIIPDENLEKQFSPSSDSSVSNDKVSAWTEVFDKAYDHEHDFETDFNILSWNSSYTGEPIPTEEMRIWVDSTVERIKALQPQRILEIGCGTGLLLARIAPSCKEYYATDFSQIALDYIDQRLLKKINFSNVHLLKRNADDFSGLEKENLDCIIINSVVQYFPNFTYLRQVLENCIKSIKNGTLFIGDIRNFNLLQSFLTDVELARSSQDTKTIQLKRRVQKRMMQEQELVIAPEFFYALKNEYPEISNVEIQLKRGSHQNELTMFRYDVVLHINQETKSTAQLQQIDWGTTLKSYDDLKSILINKKPESISFTKIPNSRLSSITHMQDLLHNQASVQTSGELSEALQRQPQYGVDPEAIYTLAKDLGYKVSARWSLLEPAEFFDVLFSRDNITNWPIQAHKFESLHTYMNNPLLDRMAAQWIPALKDYLKEKLPEFMIPTYFLFIKDIPVDANGKLDRKSLPLPIFDISELDKDFIAPETKTEKLLAEVWSGVLGLEKVGIKNNFFELGGDSITSILVVTRIKQRGIQITPQLLFQYSTIEALAKQIDALGDKATVSADISVDISKPFSLSGLDQQAIATLQKNFPAMEDCYPLTAMQDSMLYQHRNTPEPGLNVVHHAFTIKGRHLQMDLFEKAWEYVINHFQALRTSFVWEGLDIPLQILHKRVTINIEKADWQNITPEEQQVKLMMFIHQFRKNGFNLNKAPQSHVALIQISEDSYYFIYFFNLMLQDGWSYPIVIKTLFDCYKNLEKDKAPVLPQAYPYKHYIGWQQEQNLSASKSYWEEFLKDIDLPQPRLINRQKQNEDIQPPYVQEMLFFPEELTASVLATAKQHRLTPYTLLQGAWVMVLFKESGLDDIVFGSIFSGRSNAIDDIENGVGLFFNLLPIRIKVDKEDNLMSWMKKLQDVGVETSKYEHTPIRQIYDWCNLPKDKHLFESYLVSETLPHLLSIFEDWQDMGATPVDMMAQTEHALRVIVFFTEKLLIININYYQRFYKKEKVASMIQDMKKLLEAFVAQPNLKFEEYVKIIKD